jgi:hypothetical protein
VGTASLDRYLAPITPVPSLRQRFANYRRELVDAAGVDVVASEEPLADPDLLPLSDSAGGGTDGLHLYRNFAAWPRAFVAESAETVAGDTAAVARTIAAHGPVRALPERVVLSAARTGRAVAPEALWAGVEWFYPALRERRAPDAAPEVRAAPVASWLGDARFSPGRLRGTETIGQRQGDAVGAGGTLARAPLALDAQVDMARPGWLVVLDQDYPGWEVRVDGRPAEGRRAFGLFRAVAVERGRHDVTWRYRPASFALGLGLSLLALAATLAWLVSGWSLPSVRVRRAAL